VSIKVPIGRFIAHPESVLLCFGSGLFVAGSLISRTTRRRNAFTTSPPGCHRTHAVTQRTVNYTHRTTIANRSVSGNYNCVARRHTFQNLHPSLVRQTGAHVHTTRGTILQEI
jgi:hypothetical protein